MRLVLSILLGLGCLLSACVPKEVEQQVAHEVKAREERQGLFAAYLNRRLNLDDATIEGLTLGGVELGSSCGREYAPLLRLGLDGYIEAIENKTQTPIDFSCVSASTRRVMEICDFKGLPKVDKDCRNQLALLRVRLVAQLEADAAIGELPADLLAHRMIDELMRLNKTKPAQVLSMVDHFLALKPDDIDAHSIRVLLLVVSAQVKGHEAAFEASMQRLQASPRERSRSFANLMQFNVAHLAFLEEHSTTNLRQLREAATQLAQLSPHPLAGREAEAAAAFYSGDRQKALAIMREAANLPQADEITRQGLANLEAGIDKPFKIRMFYLFQF